MNLVTKNQICHFLMKALFSNNNKFHFSVSTSTKNNIRSISNKLKDVLIDQNNSHKNLLRTFSVKLFFFIFRLCFFLRSIHENRTCFQLLVKKDWLIKSRGHKMKEKKNIKHFFIDC